MVIALFAIGCGKNSPAAGGGGGGGGGGDGGTATAVAGLAVPEEISALPTKTSSPSNLTAGGAGASLSQALRASTHPRLSDYEKSTTVKYVDERALSQFSILNTIFNAIVQTHYADPANVNQGPYGAMVAWQEDKGDSQEKKIVPWVVDSQMRDDGKNEVHVWMLMPMGEDGSTHLIKVKMLITEAPTKNDDGSYADYGAWRIDAAMDTGGAFAAEASRDAEGLSLIAIRDGGDGNGPNFETTGVLHKSDSAGYGKVKFPDYNACQGSCDQTNPPPLRAVAYAYDPDTVALKKGQSAPSYKARTQVADVVQRYGLYDANGTDVTKLYQFGFPLQYTVNGGTRYGYYGAWQGRHQVWGNGAGVDAGTTVAKQNWGSNAAAESYTVSPVFTGILVKRTLVPSSLVAIQGIVLNTWVNTSASITYSAGTWSACYNPMGWDQVHNQQLCGSTGTFDTAQLTANTALHENVWISGNGGQNYVYQGGTFYTATQNNGQLVSTGIVWPPTDGANLWVNVNKPVYFYWDGSQWMQKVVSSLDQNNNPVFSGVENPVSLTPNQDYYGNDMGTNYVVRFDGTNTTVKVEQQQVANPVNASEVAPTGTTFKRAWNGDTQSVFTFNTTTLKLVYATVGPQDAGHQVDDVLDTGEWNLVATASGVQQPEMYSWEYPNQGAQPGDSYGKQQFLLDSNQQYVILHDPIRLAPISLTNGAAQTKNYSLQFDGNWVGGLPDIWSDMQAAGYDMTGAIADKVVVIPDGQQVSGADGATYTFKQLQVSEYLLPAAAEASLDATLTLAADITLGTQAPFFVDPVLGDMPVVAVKYVEGALVQ
jgi:hypothetical protein